MRGAFLEFLVDLIHAFTNAIFFGMMRAQNFNDSCNEAIFNGRRLELYHGRRGFQSDVHCKQTYDHGKNWWRKHCHTRKRFKYVNILHRFSMLELFILDYGQWFTVECKYDSEDAWILVGYIKLLLREGYLYSIDPSLPVTHDWKLFSILCCYITSILQVKIFRCAVLSNIWILKLVLDCKKWSKYLRM